MLLLVLLLLPVTTAITVVVAHSLLPVSLEVLHHATVKYLGRGLLVNVDCTVYCQQLLVVVRMLRVCLIIAIVAEASMHNVD
jgi:hypothetical protein